jgi:site-specific DNA-cytosine methylase
MFIRRRSGPSHERGHMDTSKAVTHVGLCAGYGGIELGLKRAIPNLRSIALCEVETFAVANLVAKMESGQLEPAPVWPNLKTFPWESFRGCVDMLTGGYPCQPFSAAGKRQGADDPRHLWPYIARGIRILQPRLCFFENVEGHISLGLSDVIEDLAGMGYRTTWGIFSASEVGAPHQRKRVFILAVSSGFRGTSGLSGSFTRYEGQSGEPDYGSGQAAWPSRPGEQQYRWEPPRVVENTRHKRQAKQQIDADRTEQSDIRQTQSSLGRNLDGSSGRLDYAQLCVATDNRTDELRLLGNGVVPATAELAYRTLARELLQNPG